MSEFYNNEFKDLIVQKEDHLLWITLNNPSMRNAITTDMIESLCSVLTYADRDQEVRVMILSGADKAFCAGGDVKAMQENTGMFAGSSNELRLNYEFGIQRIPKTIESLQTPIIAMVNGAAIGAGCDLSMMCDIRVASEYAKFGETFSKLGLVPGVGGTFLLQRVVGYAKAMEIFLTGDILDAKKSLELGVVNHIFKSEDLRSKTKELALKIASNAPVAIAFTKMALKQGYQNSLSSQLELLAAYQGIAQRTNDHKAGVEAVINKERPEFSGL